MFRQKINKKTRSREELGGAGGVIGPFPSLRLIVVIVVVVVVFVAGVAFFWRQSLKSGTIFVFCFLLIYLFGLKIVSPILKKKNRELLLIPIIHLLAIPIEYFIYLPLQEYVNSVLSKQSYVINLHQVNMIFGSQKKDKLDLACSYFEQDYV